MTAEEEKLEEVDGFGEWCEVWWWRGVGGGAGGDGGKQRRNSSISHAVLARSSSAGDFGRAGDSFRNVRERVRRAGIFSLYLPFDLPYEAMPTGGYGGRWLIRPMVVVVVVVD